MSTLRVENITDNSNVQSLTLPGTVVYFANTSAPSGWIKANGASLSTTAYSKLFGAIGYTFGGSGGSFNVPDLRGEFIRGWDDARGIDSGRGLGSFQTASRVTYVNDSRITSPQTLAAGNGEDNASITGAIQNSYAANNNQSLGSYAVRPRNIALLACIKY